MVLTVMKLQVFTIKKFLRQVLITIDSVFKTAENFYLQVILKECEK